ncbi:probable polyamine oxidase 5 [Drosophila ananassae]|uniref:probable polyamine oxidase 5 n=1 Tax=Drosophila ananassae TaxID=7217 RepID=UPI0013A5EE46|nr:probable polyamine oxidase 5 [Drosophila ananassae]
MSSCMEIPSSLVKTKETARIVIIGAGASGIAAATRLLEQGFKHVTVFEAEDRIGGRINTIPFGENVMDLGAQWCHGEGGNVVYEKVKDLDVLKPTGEYQMHFLRSNKDILSEGQSRAIAEFLATFKVDENYEGSVGDFVTQLYWKDAVKDTDNKTVAKEALDCMKKVICTSDACDHLFELSTRNHLNFKECDGDQNLSWKDKGFWVFLSLLLGADKDKPGDQGSLKGHVRLNRRIAEINWSGSGELLLRCWNGEIVRADHVICTVSLGVLKEKHPKLFVPPLPSPKLKAIDGLNLGTVNKLILEFEEQPLPEPMLDVMFLWVEADLRELQAGEFFWLESLCGFHRVDGQPRILEGWIIGAHARYMETLTEEKVLEGIQWLFRKFCTFDVPHPKRFLRTQWHSNPNFRGSYSYYPTYSDEIRAARSDLESPLSNMAGNPRLQFAGEASSRDHFSTVHGATESGWREADRLIEFYKGRDEI